MYTTTTLESIKFLANFVLLVSAIHPPPCSLASVGGSICGDVTWNLDGVFRARGRCIHHGMGRKLRTQRKPGHRDDDR
jgi:hypothetical protein